MSYYLIIGVSLVIIISYFFNLVSRKTNIPSVLLLIGLGIGIKEILIAAQIGHDINFMPMLEILGIVGLIMIVLEAALDLELTKEKRPLIIRSFLVALFGLVLSSLVIAVIISLVITQDFSYTYFFNSLIYAIPLSIMSSAIIIPSVGGLDLHKKEFMIYESTFSDILGIMFFYFLVGNENAPSAGHVVWDVLSNIAITIVVSVILSYLLVWVFQHIRTQVKLFLIIAVLLLLYSIGKMMHFSSLIIILVFGLILNNPRMFFKGFLRNFIHDKKINRVQHDFHLITVETAFVVRTFFFVIFGITISLASLVNLKIGLISAVIVASLYAIRFLALRIIVGKDIITELFIAPRGLITILLFFAIPKEFTVPGFDSGILLYTILISSVIMTISLIMGDRQITSIKEVTKKEVAYGPHPMPNFFNLPKNLRGKGGNTENDKS